MAESNVSGNSAEPVVVVVSGLVASGKSTLARALAERLGAQHLEADRVRGTLLEAVTAEEAGAEARWRRDLSASFEKEVYDDLIARAKNVLAGGQSLVLDACFPRRTQRQAARGVASQYGVPFLFVHCQISDDTLQARLEERDRAAGSHVWGAIYHALAEHYEPASEIDESERVEVVTEGSTEPIVDQIVGRMSGVAGKGRGGAASPPAAKLSPKVVSFDCWGTLLAEEDWAWAHGLRVMALQEAAHGAGFSVSPEVAERAFTAGWARHMQLWREGVASGAPEVAKWCLEELRVKHADIALADLIHRFEEASHTSRVVALDGAEPLLASLRTAAIPAVLVCDTGLTPGRVVRRLLSRAGLRQHLSVLVFSDEVRAPKPDSIPFHAAIDPLHVEPADVVHVGDLRRTDVAGARALGMKTVRIRARHDDTDESEGPEADFVVDSHYELAEILGLPPL